MCLCLFVPGKCFRVEYSEKFERSSIVGTILVLRICPLLGVTMMNFPRLGVSLMLDHMRMIRCAGCWAKRLSVCLTHADVITDAKPDLGDINLEEALRWGEVNQTLTNSTSRKGTAFDYASISFSTRKVEPFGFPYAFPMRLICGKG